MRSVAPGFSQAAEFLDKAKHKALKRFRESAAFARQAAYDELAEVYNVCRQPNGDAEGAEAIAQDTLRNAYLFIEALPYGFPLPRISAEPDGHMNLEWYRQAQADSVRERQPRGNALLGCPVRDRRSTGLVPVLHGYSRDNPALDRTGLCPMIDPTNVPPIEDDELLSRFILHSNEFRADESVTPALFMPYKLVVLSVNRHRDATLEETWEIARRVASNRQKTLYGRSDIKAVDCKIDSLSVVAKPIFPDNMNHANIEGYPPKKEDQKALALKLAAAASKRIAPP